MDLFDVISNDIKEAMKAKDKVKLETLRNVKKFFLEAKTAPGANDTLTDDAALKIMQKLVKQGKDSAAIYRTRPFRSGRNRTGPGSRYRSLSAETDGGRRIGSCFENNHCRSRRNRPARYG